MTEMTGVEAEERLRRVAMVRTLRLGETTVTYLPDGAVQLRPRGWFPDTTEDTWASLSEYLDDTGNLVGSIGGLLVERGGRAMLIDTGFGPASLPAGWWEPVGAIRGGALLDNLAAAGRRPEEIEAVAFTHLHTDHIGWARHRLDGAGRSAFGDAPFLVAETEWARPDLAEVAGTSRDMLAALAPQVRTVADGDEVFPGVRVRTTGGHTIGHTGYVIDGGGERLIAFGDALHSPAQVGRPSWRAVSDHDAALAAEVRRALLDDLAEPHTIGFGNHFADVVFGRVVAADDGPVWRPEP
jgi:glyoxylase-like metal-dependent hydrolase (beta-lactamase superfamily II)